MHCIRESMKSHWFTHRGKRVWFADYSHFGVESKDLQKEMDEIFEVLSREKTGSFSPSST